MSEELSEGTFKVEIDGKIQDVIVQEPRGQDQLDFFEMVDKVGDNEGYSKFIKDIDKYVSKATGLTVEQVVGMKIIDKQKMAKFLLQRYMGFMIELKGFIQS